MANLEQQQEAFNNIKTLCNNFKKDSMVRKTIEYLIKRLTSLESQWIDFDRRHTTIMREIENPADIDYFKNDVYEKTKVLYDSTKTEMENLLQRRQAEAKPVKFDFTDILDKQEDENVKKLIMKQNCNFKAMSHAMEKIDLTTPSERWELEQQLAILKTKWEAIDKLHWELETSMTDTDEKYSDMFQQIEQSYDEMRKKISGKIWSSTHYEKSSPKIEIPEFNGKYTKWLSFKDLFIEAIHNNPLINNAQKMQHLKSKLKGEAERLVCHLPISAENYNPCWEMMKQRYDNQRIQFTSYLNTIMDLPTIKQPDSFNLKRMHDVIQECLNGLETLGVDTIASGPIFCHLMSLKLDDKTFDEYAKEIQDPRSIPNLNELLYFLESKFLAYETKKRAKPEANKQQQNQQNNKQKTGNDSPAKKPYHYEPKKSHFTGYGQCPNCNENHVLMQCPKFVSMDASERNKTITKLRNICKNCLFSHGESNEACKSTKRCKECNKPHHTLLHQAKPTKQQPSTSGDPPQSAHHLSDKHGEVLLTTVQLLAKSANGTYIPLRALLDQGSQVNLITENAAQLIKLPRKKLNATITGVGSASGDCKGQMQITCKSIHSDYKFETEVMIMRKITNNLPNFTFEKANWPHLENLKLADPDYNLSRPIDLLLGAEVYSQIILDGMLRGNQQQNSPVAQQTHLGWILCGKLTTLNCHVTLVDLKEMTKFWETEEINKKCEDVSKNDHCEEFYTKTVKREPDGKYTVKMPLCPDMEKNLGNSKPAAISQFIQLEKKLERNKKLAHMYRDFIKEYSDLGHMTLSSPTPNVTLESYLPHHGVLREHSTTTKLRVVFNASQKTSTGNSLNSQQEKGPNLQKDIQTLIIKWRSCKYAYTADIEKMYRCIWLSKDQQQLQKIIWRNSPVENLQEYQLCTLTYGMKCAPWLAMRTLLQLATDDGEKYPVAAQVLKNDFFMDDLVSGCNSLEQAQNIQKQLISLLQGAGMNLRKWSSNHPTLLKNLGDDKISTKQLYDFKDQDTMKTLGLGWNPNYDVFTLNWTLEEQNKKLTKRFLLSEISKLYDPLGWLAPVTVTAKLLFQRVWMCNIGWNDILPDDIQNEWRKLKTELPEINNIKQNRWIGGTGDIELLGFSDASQKAYASVVYSKVLSDDGQPIITLLVSKTRVAPLSQRITLPRLELNGALLLSQLIEKTIAALPGRNVTVRAWCDSQVVLAWLQGDVSKWERYVANRIAKITPVIPGNKWQYVKSEENPADCASRGLYPKKLINHQLWWNGPEFLKTQENNALETSTNVYVTTIGQTKPSATTKFAKPNEHFINELLEQRSSLTRVTRVVAYVMRFIKAMRSDQTINMQSCYLTASELIEASELITKSAQQKDFEDEYRQLSAEKTVSSKSPIFKLHPYLDQRGVIRVGGRLNKSNLPLDIKNPAIISRTGRLAQLIIYEAHLATLHGGARLCLAYIRQRYWIVSGNRTVKDYIRKCVRCFRHKPTDTQQIMADLPPQRTIPSRPFTHVGVDFTGHVEVKLNKGRGVKTSKGYIAIFVCMVTKAVHIELVSDLSTQAFIAAFKRMCARRGTPKHVYSDCGTNFIGASKMLRKEFEDFKQELTEDFFSEIGKMEVKWHFNAPAWPTAGGLWEAAVKAMKYHLRRVLGTQKLTYEEFITLLSQIEACLNSRPLCPLTECPDEFYNYLTPGHFLTGSATLSLPLSDYTDVKTIDLRLRWQLTEHMLQQFWRNWSGEYLQQLQARTKWNKITENLKKGDIVMVREENLPPGKWALGRVLELHPGSDGLVRVTTLKTESGTIKRPITKLSRLPINSEVTPETEKPLKDTSNNKTSKAKRSNMAMLCLWTFLLMLTGTTATTKEAQISTLEPPRPVYYDKVGQLQIIHDEWTLLMYYNLTNYWHGVEQITTYLNQVNSFCNMTDPRYCQITMQQLQHEMDTLDHYNRILLAPHTHLTSRRKRGLVDGVGYVANSLFGILDQRFADKYKQDIEAIQINQNYALDLIKNQTSIVELQNNLLQASEDNINKQFKQIDNYMKETEVNLAKVESEMEIVMATSYFNSASLAAFLLINNLRKVQNLLFDTLTDVYKGHVDVQLVAPTLLLDQLQEISGKLPKSLCLPVDNIRTDIKDIYKLMYVKARVTSSYFLFEVHLPLITDEDFILHKIIPLPMKAKTETIMVQPSSTYIAVDLKKNNYITTTHEYLQQCTRLKKERIICNTNLPIYNLNKKDAPCEAKLLSQHSTSPCTVHEVQCKDEWVQLHATNTWLATCCSNACSLRTICENDVTSQTITAPSIVTIPPGCVLQTSQIMIHSYNVYAKPIDMSSGLIFQLPSINGIVNLNLSHTFGEQIPDQIPVRLGVEEIATRLKSLKDSEAAGAHTYLSSHDLHQYAISYTLLAVVATMITVWAVKARCCRPRPAVEEDIELQSRRPPLRPVPQRRVRSPAPHDNPAFEFD